MSLESKVNEPIKRYKGLSRISKLALATFFAFGSAFLTKGCSDDEGSSVSYEGVWNISWSYNYGSANLNGTMPIAVTSGGAYGANGSEHCSIIAPSIHGNHTCRIYGNINPSTGVIVGTHEGGCATPNFTFAGQCDTAITGSAAGTYNFIIDFDKQ